VTGGAVTDTEATSYWPAGPQPRPALRRHRRYLAFATSEDGSESVPGEFDGPWIFSVRGSTDICGDISEYSLATPASAQALLLQPQDRKTWGWELPPGHYRSITTLYEWPVCIYNDRTGHLGVNGPSTGGYIISATGKKTTPTSTLNS
jgi:hypothetical protein